MVRLLLTALLLAWASAAHAATYYVATTGNNSADGSSGTPWLTIAKCASTIVAGDTCIIRDGTYTENVTEATDGSSGSKITYQAENRHAAILVGIFTGSGDYLVIDGLKFMPPDYSDGPVVVSGAGSLVTHVLVSPTSTHLGLNNVGIQATGSAHTLSDNRVERMCFGILIDGSDILVEDNVVTHPYRHKKADESNACGDADFMRFFGSRNTIRGNRMMGVVEADIGDAHLDCFQAFDNSSGTPVIDTVIEQNYCEDAGQAIVISAVTQGLSENVIIRNNVLVRASAYCVLIQDVDNVQILNNTCDMTGGLHGIFCVVFNFTASCEFKNNIIYGTSGDQSLYNVYDGATLIDGSQTAPGKNNLLYKQGYTITVPKPGGYATAYTADVLNADPAFVLVSEQRYQLTTGSPAKDAGFAVEGWTSPTDKDGAPRPQGAAWDIGAYEYGWIPNPPTTPRKPEN